MTTSGGLPTPGALQALVERAAGPELGPELSFRPMFGGIMGYVVGRPFTSLSAVGLALKLAEADRAGFLTLEGAQPLRYKPDQPPSRTYVLAPATLFDDISELGAWIGRSARHAKSLPAKSSPAKSLPARPASSRKAIAKGRSGRPQ